MYAATTIGTVLAISLLQACAAPCRVDDDCADGQYCGDEGDARVCATDCVIDDDCADYAESCSARGRCEAAAAAIVDWVSPAEGAIVGDVFDVEVSVRFVGREVALTLDKPPELPGSRCAGFAPETVRLPGSTTAETTHIVRFADVRASGLEFGLEITTVVDDGFPRFARRVFAAPATTEPEGLVVVEPSTPEVPLATRARSPLSLPIDVRIGSTASEVWGRIVPREGPPTPLRLLATDTDRLVDLRHAVALGPQVLDLVFDVGGITTRCALAVTATPAVIDPIEVGLTFTGSEPTDLDLWVYAETDDGDVRICTPALATAPCLGGYVRPGLLGFGEESVGLALADGLYGVAVIPGAATDPVSALVRLSREGAHETFVGPFTVRPASGEVWLAARLYVVGGTMTVEPLARVVDGAPSGGPATW